MGDLKSEYEARKGSWNKLPEDAKILVRDLLITEDKDNITMALAIVERYSPFLKQLYEEIIVNKDLQYRKIKLDKVNKVLWKKA